MSLWASRPLLIIESNHACWVHCSKCLQRVDNGTVRNRGIIAITDDVTALCWVAWVDHCAKYGDGMRLQVRLINRSGIGIFCSTSVRYLHEYRPGTCCV